MTNKVDVAGGSLWDIFSKPAEPKPDKKSKALGPKAAESGTNFQSAMTFFAEAASAALPGYARVSRSLSEWKDALQKKAEAKSSCLAEAESNFSEATDLLAAAEDLGEAGSVLKEMAAQKFAAAGWSFMELGMEERAGEAIGYAKSFLTALPAAEQSDALFEIAGRYQSCGMSELAAETFGEIVSLGEAPDADAALSEKAGLAKGMQAILEGDIELAKSTLASLGENPIALSMLGKIAEIERLAMQFQSLEVFKLSLEINVQGYRESGQGSTADQLALEGAAEIEQMKQWLGSGEVKTLKDAVLRMKGEKGHSRLEWALFSTYSRGAGAMRGNPFWRFLDKTADEKMTPELYMGEILRLAQGLLQVQDKTAQINGYTLAKNLESDPTVGAETTAYLQALEAGPGWGESLGRAVKTLICFNPTGLFLTLMTAGSDEEVKETLIGTGVGLATFGVGRLSGVGAKYLFSGSRLSAGIGSTFWREAATYGVATAAEAGGFTLSGMLAESAVSGKWDQWSFAEAGKRWLSMVVVFGACGAMGAGAKPLANAGYKMTAKSMTVSGIVIADYFNEAVGLHDPTERQAWQRFVDAFVMDAQMSATHKAVDKLTGGKLGELEIAAAFQSKLPDMAKTVETLKSAGYEFDPKAVMQAALKGETPKNLGEQVFVILLDHAVAGNNINGMVAKLPGIFAELDGVVPQVSTAIAADAPKMERNYALLGKLGESFGEWVGSAKDFLAKKWRGTPKDDAARWAPLEEYLNLPPASDEPLGIHTAGEAPDPVPYDTIPDLPAVQAGEVAADATEWKFGDPVYAFAGGALAGMAGPIADLPMAGQIAVYGGALLLGLLGMAKITEKGVGVARNPGTPAVRPDKVAGAKTPVILPTLGNRMPAAEKTALRGRLESLTTYLQSLSSGTPRAAWHFNLEEMVDLPAFNPIYRKVRDALEAMPGLARAISGAEQALANPRLIPGREKLRLQARAEELYRSLQGSYQAIEHWQSLFNAGQGADDFANPFRQDLVHRYRLDFLQRQGLDAASIELERLNQPASNSAAEILDVALWGVTSKDGVERRFDWYEADHDFFREAFSDAAPAAGLEVVLTVRSVRDADILRDEILGRIDCQVSETVNGLSVVDARGREFTVRIKPLSTDPDNPPNPSGPDGGFYGFGERAGLDILLTPSLTNDPFGMGPVAAEHKASPEALRAYLASGLGDEALAQLDFLLTDSAENRATIQELREAIREKFNGVYPSLQALHEGIYATLLERGIDVEGAFAQRRDEIITQATDAPRGDTSAQLAFLKQFQELNQIDGIFDNLLLQLLPDDVPLYRSLKSGREGVSNPNGRSDWGFGEAGKAVASTYNTGGRVTVTTTLGEMRQSGIVIIDTMAVTGNAISLHHALDPDAQAGDWSWQNVPCRTVAPDASAPTDSNQAIALGALLGSHGLLATFGEHLPNAWQAGIAVGGGALLGMAIWDRFNGWWRGKPAPVAPELPHQTTFPSDASFSFGGDATSQIQIAGLKSRLKLAGNDEAGWVELAVDGNETLRIAVQGQDAKGKSHWTEQTIGGGKTLVIPYGEKVRLQEAAAGQDEIIMELKIDSAGYRLFSSSAVTRNQSIDYLSLETRDRKPITFGVGNQASVEFRNGQGRFPAGIYSRIDWASGDGQWMLSRLRGKVFRIPVVDGVSGTPIPVQMSEPIHAGDRILVQPKPSDPSASYYFEFHPEVKTE